MIVILLLEIAVGIAGVLLKNRTEYILIEALNKTRDQYGSNNTEITAVWDNIQREVRNNILVVYKVKI